MAWDGIIGLKLVQRRNRQVIKDVRFDYADYLESAVDKGFSLALTTIDFSDYTARILAMHRAFQAARVIVISSTGNFPKTTATIREY